MLRHRTQSHSMPGYASAPVIRTHNPDVNIFFSRADFAAGDNNPYRPTTTTTDSAVAPAAAVNKFNWRRVAQTVLRDHVPWTFLLLTAVQVAVFLSGSEAAKEQLTLSVDRGFSAFVSNGTFQDAAH